MDNGAQKWEWAPSGSGGVTTFLELNDVLETSYTIHNLKRVVVNQPGTGLVFEDFVWGFSFGGGGYINAGTSWTAIPGGQGGTEGCTLVNGQFTVPTGLYIACLTGELGWALRTGHFQLQVMSDGYPGDFMPARASSFIGVTKISAGPTNGGSVEYGDAPNSLQVSQIFWLPTGGAIWGEARCVDADPSDPVVLQESVLTIARIGGVTF